VIAENVRECTILRIHQQLRYRPLIVLKNTAFTLIAAVVVVLAVIPACRRRTDNAPPVATPSFSASRPRAPLGSPVEITYRFVVAQNATFAEDYRVLAHFVDKNEELMWTDDHAPAIPTSKWSPGQTVEYRRTMFVPIYPYIGDAGVYMGLYSARNQQRLPLTGEDMGQRAYRVGTIQLLPQSESVFIIHKDGWHQPEVAPDNPAIEWQWTKKHGTLAFRNPKRDVTFYLHFDGRPDLFAAPQQVAVQVNGVTVDTVAVDTRDEIIRKVPITAAQLGAGDMVDMKVAVDQTFIPAITPAAKSNDRRELGVRVFHTYVE
jgi:hypothetical protein